MSTMHTPPIDQYEVDEAQEERAVERDDRETGFVFPDDNGDPDEPAIAAGQHRLYAVLGW